MVIEGATNGDAGDTCNLIEGQGHLVTYEKNGNRTSDMYQDSQQVAAEILNYKPDDVK